MPKLLFFSRVALLCNLCFLVAFLMHYLPDLRNGIVPSTTIILGNVVAIVLNMMLNLLFLLLFLAGRMRMANIPLWMILANFIFFIFQVVLLVK